MISQHGHITFLFNPHFPRAFFTAAQLLQVERQPKNCLVQYRPFKMPQRSSKAKSAVDKAVPVITAHGRQRTLSTKQQLLRKSPDPFVSSRHKLRF